MKRVVLVFVLLSLFLTACSNEILTSNVLSNETSQNTVSQHNENLIVIDKTPFEGTIDYIVPSFEEMIANDLQLLVTARYNGKYMRCGRDGEYDPYGNYVSLCFDVTAKHCGNIAEKEITVEAVRPTDNYDRVELSDERIVFYNSKGGIEYVYQKGAEYLLMLSEDNNRQPNEALVYFQITPHFIKSNDLNAINGLNGLVKVSAECERWVWETIEPGDSEVPRFIEYVCMVFETPQDFISDTQ